MNNFIRKNLNFFLPKLLLLNRLSKELIALSVDVLLCFMATMLSLYFITDGFNFFSFELIKFFLISLTFIPIFYIFKIYKVIFRFISFSLILRIYISIFFYIFVLLFVLEFLKILNIVYVFSILHSLIFSLFIIIFRIFIFILYDYSNKLSLNKPRAIIYVKSIDKHKFNNFYFNNYNIIGIIDEDRENWGKKINNYRIFSFNEIYKFCKRKSIETILIVNENDIIYKRDLIQKSIKDLNIFIKIVPHIDDLIDANKVQKNLTNIVSLNLINRNIKWDKNLISNEIKNQSILITGAGGSIGSELCRQIILLKPKNLICVDISEYNLFNLKNELNDYKNKENLNNNISYNLLSILDKKQIKKIFHDYRIDIVFHAAAYKHVSLIEDNISSAIRTNIFGSINIINESIDNNVDKLILVSTDKAVRPLSVMGYTKRFAEIYLQYCNQKISDKNIQIGAVRFGNVFGSAGSVIELFNHQINNRFPVTITHQDVTRYFMTIPEASILLIQSLLILKEGEIFLLDMGKPFKIIEIAKKMIFFAGMSEKNKLNPDGDVEIKIIGLKKGEKMHEELLISNEIKRSSYAEILIEQKKLVQKHDINDIIVKLESYIELGREEESIKLIKSIVD